MAFPTNPMALYWTYWAPVQRIHLFPTSYNIIFLFQCEPVGGPIKANQNGSIILKKPSGAPGTNYNVDVQTCRSRGQRVIMTVGGGGAQIYLTDQARADAFVASVKQINTDLKVGTSLFGSAATVQAIDGIDWNNYETITSEPNLATWMAYAATQLRAYYGSNFYFTSPPAGYDFSPGPNVVADRLLLAKQYSSGVLDWICPQFYDPSDNNTTAQVRTGLDFYHTAVIVSGVGSVTIPRSVIGIGYAIKPTGASSTTRWGRTEAAACYNTMVSEGRTPRGAFNFSSEEDPTSTFATTMTSVINPDLTGADTTAPVPGNSGTITVTNLSDVALTLNWTKAIDDATAQSALTYEVRRSGSNNISTVANAEANGTIVQAYTTDISSFAQTGLSPSTTYYWNVIVKDASGNKAVYTTKSQTTTPPNTRVFTAVGTVTGLQSIII